MINFHTVVEELSAKFLGMVVLTTASDFGHISLLPFPYLTDTTAGVVKMLVANEVYVVHQKF